jgi:hypothetical protein
MGSEAVIENCYNTTRHRRHEAIPNYADQDCFVVYSYQDKNPLVMLSDSETSSSINIANLQGEEDPSFLRMTKS